MTTNKRINSGNYLDLLNKVFACAKEDYTLSVNPYHGLRLGLYKEITLVHKTSREAVEAIVTPDGVTVSCTDSTVTIKAFSQEKLIPVVILQVQKGFSERITYKHVAGEYTVTLECAKVTSSNAPVSGSEPVLDNTPTVSTKEEENALQADTGGLNVEVGSVVDTEAVAEVVVDVKKPKPTKTTRKNAKKEDK